MDKQALSIDSSVVGRHALGGALVGMSAASLIELAHTIALARREARMKSQPTETDENTIVLTLPKQAEITGTAVTPKVEGTKSGNFSLNRGQPQSRETGSGKYGPKLCADKQASGDTGWPTLTASLLAAIAGTAGGASLVNKIVERQRQKRMQSELDLAQQEYMDLLSGKAVKGAETVEQMFGGFECDPGEKQAGDTFGMLNYPLAAMAILTILGSGATGYLTKRVLDEQAEADNGASRDFPKVKRIVFRSSPEADPTKQASVDDCACAAAGLLVMMDRVGGTDRFVGHPAVKTALDKSGMDKAALVNAAQDWDKLVSVLGQDPDLRKALTRLYIDQTTPTGFGRFFKRMATSLPFVQRSADQKLMDALNQVRFQGSVPAGTVLPPKMAAGGGVASMMTGGLLGSAISGERITKAELAQLIQEAQAANEASAPKPSKDVVQVAGADAGAKAYVAKHGPRIQALIKRLAAEGQL